jgi:hypothetical protein
MKSFLEKLNEGLTEDSATMGDTCEHCNNKAMFHKAESYHCPVNGPGSGFHKDKQFSKIDGDEHIRRIATGQMAPK